MFKIPTCIYQTSIKWNTKIWPFVDTLSCQKAQKDLKKETLKWVTLFQETIVQNVPNEIVQETDFELYEWLHVYL